MGETRAIRLKSKRGLKPAPRVADRAVAGKKGICRMLKEVYLHDERRTHALSPGR